MEKNTSFKTHIINLASDSFKNGDKKKLKNILHVLTENKELSELYLLYENIENKYFSDKEIATLYVEKLSNSLCGKSAILKRKDIKTFLNESVENYNVENSELYSNIDVLLNEDTLNNIDTKILAKKYLINYLTTKRESEVLEDIPQVVNENLLNTVLVTNFNTYYDNVLSEDEKTELKNLILLSEEELNENFKTLKNEISEKLTELLKESTGDLKEKLELTNDEVQMMKSTKINYHKLLELKNGL